MPRGTAIYTKRWQMVRNGIRSPIRSTAIKRRKTRWHFIMHIRNQALKSDCYSLPEQRINISRFSSLNVSIGWAGIYGVWCDWIGVSHIYVDERARETEIGEARTEPNTKEEKCDVLDIYMMSLCPERE